MANLPKYEDEAAFPQPHTMRIHPTTQPDVLFPAQCGLTKREWLAGVALQGILTNPSQLATDVENQTGLAVEYADALLKTLRV